MLIWFLISLVPAMVTPFSPNFVRTIASWPVPFVFAGVAMSEVVQWAGKRQAARGNPHSAIRIPVLAVGAFVLILGYNAILTARDYFVQWPTSDYVRFWQQATWTQAVRALNVDPSQMPIAASGLSIQDFDPQTFDLLGLRPDLKVKWFDCRTAIVYPQGVAPTRYLVPGYLPCDVSRYGAELLTQLRWPDSGEVAYSFYGLNPDHQRIWIQKLSENPVYLGNEDFNAQAPLDGLTPMSLPNFDGLQLFGGVIDRTADTPRGDLSVYKPGATVLLDTYWMIKQPVAPPDGKIVAQWDGLDVNVDTLEVGDMFAQRHRLELPADLPRGPYRLSIGAYHPDNGARLKANFDGHAVDSMVLGTLNVQ
jgi:hypothetical protein